MTREHFIDEMVAWLNRRFGGPTNTVFRADTALFARGRIDSIRILELIAWTERAIGRTIADEQIRMDNFSSVRRIAEVFGGAMSDVAA